MRTVLLALAANLGIAFAKLVAAVITGSGALVAETAHAFADSGNEVLLLVAQRRSAHPPDERHPVGYGREAYFWALIASFGVFVTGALVSVRQGLVELLAPAEVSSYAVAYSVLAVSLVLESASLLQAYRQLHEEAHRLSRNFLEQLLMTSDPTSRAVFGEDAAAVCGNLIAIVGVALHQVTGSVVPDALAAIAIGVLLAAVGFLLARRNRDFLIGEPASPAITNQIRRVISAQPGVLSIEELLVTFVGPRRLWVIGRVDVADDLPGGQVEELARRPPGGPGGAPAPRSRSRPAGRVAVHRPRRHRRRRRLTRIPSAHVS